MVGDLDISTPYDNAVLSTMYGYNQTATQHLVVLPMAPHVGFLQSPQFGTNVPCGLEIIATFFASNGTVVDSNCLANMIPLDWLGELSTSVADIGAYFGTTDLWEYDGPQPLVLA
jgi:hypothetical protein